MQGPIEELYFNWLCAKVIDIHISNYWDLMTILHQTEYVWIVQGDLNREEDGRELREDFLRETFHARDESWLFEPCSVLEFLIAFAKRAQFQTDMPVQDWFWIFMRNLGLDEYRQVPREHVPVIEDILQTFLTRSYSPNGDGGMFPLRRTNEDQRKVEIWYQFCEYLDDQGLM